MSLPYRDILRYVVQALGHTATLWMLSQRLQPYGPALWRAHTYTTFISLYSYYFSFIATALYFIEVQISVGERAKLSPCSRYRLDLTAIETRYPIFSHSHRVEYVGFPSRESHLFCLAVLVLLTVLPI